MARLFICVFLCLLIPAIAFAQVESSAGDPFRINNVDVSITDADAVKAREAAFAEAQIKAFQELAGRIAPGTTKEPDAHTVSMLVRSFSVSREKISKTSYSGTYSFLFKERAVRNYLGIPQNSNLTANAAPGPYGAPKSAFDALLDQVTGTEAPPTNPVYYEHNPLNDTQASVGMTETLPQTGFFEGFHTGSISTQQEPLVTQGIVQNPDQPIRQVTLQALTGSLQGWVELKRQLEYSNMVRNIRILSMSAQSVTVQMTVQGNDSDLQTVLANAGYNLRGNAPNYMAVKGQS